MNSHNPPSSLTGLLATPIMFFKKTYEDFQRMIALLCLKLHGIVEASDPSTGQCTLELQAGGLQVVLHILQFHSHLRHWVQRSRLW